MLITALRSVICRNGQFRSSGVLNGDDLCQRRIVAAFVHRSEGALDHVAIRTVPCGIHFHCDHRVAAIVSGCGLVKRVLITAFRSVICRN